MPPWISSSAGSARWRRGNGVVGPFVIGRPDGAGHRNGAAMVTWAESSGRKGNELVRALTSAGLALVVLVQVGCASGAAPAGTAPAAPSGPAPDDGANKT